MQPTERFSKTVDNYVKYRPSYPKEVLELLKTECNLQKDTVIADIGSGTGLLTKILLENDNQVYGVEPNAEMRHAGEHFLHGFSNFTSIDGGSENTKLTTNSVDIITAATAFHWFEPVKTKKEFQRILKQPGWVVLIWNVRDIENALVAEYEDLITKFGTDYKTSSASTFDRTATADFFAPFTMQEAEFNNKQIFDWEGFKGRLLSSSYSLQKGDKNYEEMLLALQQIFKKYEKDGIITFTYKTKIYYGRLK